MKFNPKVWDPEIFETFVRPFLNGEKLINEMPYKLEVRDLNKIWNEGPNFTGDELWFNDIVIEAYF